MIQEITSLKDEKIQFAKSLSSLKGRLNSGKFLIEGVEAIEWAIESGVELDFILSSKSVKDLEQRFPKTAIYHLSDGLLKKVTDTKYLISVVAVGRSKAISHNTDFVVVLDNLKDYGNIGTIVRTCHAFGTDTILSTKKDMDLYQRKTVDSSRGKVFATNLKSFATPLETINYLKKQNYQVVTTSPYGDNIQSLISLTDKPVALIVGNETEGVSDELMAHADFTVQIPMHSEVESLNVGVATGISIYELRLKQLLGMIENKIKSTLGREVNVAAALIKEALDKELSKVSDLSSGQLVFMMVLKCDSVMNLVDIQKQFGIPDGETDRFFAPLIKKGYINSDSSNNFTITETGIETIGKLWTVIENTENKIMDDFTDQEKKELKRLLDKLKYKCSEIIN
ncbi:MAG: TrmH family RNA methyltransferase [Marinifilaceae bacterium]